MQVGSSTQSNTQQADLQKSQKDQEMQVQREQSKQILDDQNKMQEAAKITGVGQHLDITSQSLKLLVSLLFSLAVLHANFSALLLSARSDYLFHFSYNDIAFYCRPAAVTTIDQLLFFPKLPKVCKEQSHKFIRKYPYANKQYAYKLHEEQKYYLLGLKEDCFVMLNAGVSFSEHLLEEGFAKLQTKLDDEFLNSTLYKKLKKAQDRAEYHKKGVWEDAVLSNCFQITFDEYANRTKSDCLR